MSSPINVVINQATATSVVIPVNRFGSPEYAIQISAGSALVEGTLTPVNRLNSETPVWSTLDDKSGLALTAVVLASGVVPIENQALEAIRITSTGTTTGRLVQQGDL